VAGSCRLINATNRLTVPANALRKDCGGVRSKAPCCGLLKPQRAEIWPSNAVVSANCKIHDTTRAGMRHIISGDARKTTDPALLWAESAHFILFYVSFQ